MLLNVCIVIEEGNLEDVDLQHPFTKDWTSCFTLVCSKRWARWGLLKHSYTEWNRVNSKKNDLRLIIRAGELSLRILDVG